MSGARLKVFEGVGNTRGLGISQECTAGETIFSLPWHAALTPASSIQILLKDEAEQQGKDTGSALPAA